MESRRQVTLKGKPYTLVGPELRVNDKAPDFQLTGINLNQVTLSDSKGKTRLLSVVVSLDTPVCDAQTRRFEEEAARLKEVAIYTISMDLPFAQARYCSAQDIKNLRTLSDHREASFGKDYGVLIKELRLLSRAVFIIDRNDIIRYVEYLKEASHAPDYQEALEALNRITQARVPVA